MDKLLLVDKPASWTSFDVVNYIRKIVATAEGKKPKHVKVGHSGTLDPFATGLLIILIGVFTKQQDSFMKKDKVYEATIVLGESSTTGDPEGIITQQSNPYRPNQIEIEKALLMLTGEIEQTPPMYSAIKINGKKAYELAREGKSVELKRRKVTIFTLELISYTYPELQIRTKVSSGTYIRTLAEDIGKALGTVAYTKQLRRTQIDIYRIEDAQKIESIHLELTPE